MERKSGRSTSVPRLLSRLTTRAWEKDADIEGRRATGSIEVGLSPQKDGLFRYSLCSKPETHEDLRVLCASLHYAPDNAVIRGRKKAL